MPTAPKNLKGTGNAEPSEQTLVDIHRVRSQLVDYGLVYFCCLLPVALGLSLYRILEHGWKPLFILHIGLALLLLSGTFYRRQLPYVLRTTLLLGVCLIAGTAGLFTFGLLSGGVVFIYTFTLLAAIAFGARVGLIANAFGLAIIVIAAIQVCFGHVTYAFDPGAYATSPIAWALMGIVFLLLGPMTVIAFGVVNNHLITTIQALRESNATRNRIIQGMVGTFLYRYDSTGHIVYVSDSVTGVLGFTPDDFLAHYSQHLTDHPINNEIEKHVSDSLRGIHIPRYMAELRHKDGSHRWIEASETPVFDEKGDVISVEGVAHDITEHQQAKAALRESQTRISAILEAIPDIMFILSVDGIYLDFFAPQGTKLFVEPEMIIGRSINDILPQSVAQHCLAQVARTLAKSEVVVFEYQLPHSDGDDRTYEARMAVHDSVNVLVFVRDVTDRKLAEAEIQRHAQVIEQTSEIVVITDIDGTITYVNPAFETLTGYSDQEILGKKLRSLSSKDASTNTYEQLWATLKSGSDWSGNLLNQKKDGSPFTLSTTISSMRSPTNVVENYVAVMRDVTRELELEEQFFQSQKMEAVGQLAGGVAHDFNNLLQVIHGYSEMLKDDVEDEMALESISLILESCDRASVLIRQLLAFSRKQVLELENLDLDVIISGLVSMIQRVIGEHITFQFTPESSNKFIRADKGQIEQILINLCVNARDAMNEGGQLTIRTEKTEIDTSLINANPQAKPGAFAVLEVSDTGHGMDATTQRSIFEPFFTTKEQGKGTGLGLSTVFGITRQHGGWIHVYSEIGLGTTFRIYIPLIGSKDRKEAPIRAPEPDGGTETILLADDNDGVLSVTKTILSRAGYTVLTACDGEEACELFDKHKDSIDIALLDVVMPKRSGKIVYEYIRNAKPAMSVLFSSGYSNDGIHRNFILEEGMQLIQKPFQRDALLRKLRDILDT